MIVLAMISTLFDSNETLKYQMITLFHSTKQKKHSLDIKLYLIHSIKSIHAQTESFLMNINSLRSDIVDVIQRYTFDF